MGVLASAAAADYALAHFSRPLFDQGGRRDAHDEARAAARGRADFELTADRLDVAMNHCEPQAQAAIFPRAGPRKLRERLRRMLDQRRAHPQPGICDLEDDYRLSA